MSERWKQESRVLRDNLLSTHNLGLTCQRYQVKTHRCRTIRAIHFPRKFSIIEIEKLLVWVQLMLVPVNYPMMGSFFTLRCHYLSHSCAQGLKVLSDGSVQGGRTQGWSGYIQNACNWGLPIPGKKSLLSSQASPAALNKSKTKSRQGWGTLLLKGGKAGVLGDLIFIKDICSVLASDLRLA